MKLSASSVTLPRVIFAVIAIYAAAKYITREVEPEWFEIKGSMNGVSMVIPKSKMGFMPEYQGESWLESKPDRKPPHERSFSDELRHISLRLPYGDEDVTVQVTDSGFREKPKYLLDNINRMRKAYMSKLTKESLAKRPMTAYAVNHPKSTSSKKTLTTDIRYKIYASEDDRVHGLNWADTEGISTDYSQAWNWNYYWPPAKHTDQYGDFIRCKKGIVPGENPIPNPNLQRCHQHFYLEDIDAQVLLYYKRDKLKDWADIKEKTTELIESMYINQVNSKEKPI